MTATTKFLAGSAFNLMARGGPVYSSDEDSNYLRAQLYDNVPGQPFRWASIQTDGWVKKDLNHATNGDMETFIGNVPSGWTSLNFGGGATAKESINTHAGTGALACSVSATPGEGGAYIAFTARSGEAWELKFYAESASGGGVARVRIYNAQTGHYLTAAGTWGKAVTDCQTEAGTGSYVAHKLAFTVEDYATCRADTVTLLLKIYCSTTGGAALFDDVEIYPGVSYVSVHGHNFEPCTAFAWSYSPNDSGYVTIDTLTAYQPSFYGTTTLMYGRWLKFIQTGTPWALSAPGSIGELVLGQYQTLLTDAQHPAVGAWECTYGRPQIRNKTVVGEEFPNNQTDHPQRTLRMPYFAKDDVSFAQFRQEVTRRCEDGAEPIVIVPNDSKADVIFGRIPVEWRDRQGYMTTAHEYELMVIESPFGLSGL